MKISVLCFDLSDNAVGRADLLARLVAPLGEVEVIGPRSGPGPWMPVAGGPVRYSGVPERRMPGFLMTMAELSRRADGDLVYASKTRLGSAGIGYLKRVLGRRPLLLDIDDWEVGFYLRSGPAGTLGRALNFGSPKGLPWTWLAERLTGLANGITVASRVLQQRFGGTLIPHVRDTDAWKPGSGAPVEARRRLGITDERVVMFLGTPRGYKGLDDLGAAVAGLGRKDVRLAVVGTFPESVLGRDLARRFPSICLAPPIAFEEIPSFLSAAHVGVVPHRDTPDPRRQVRAKLFDAMALGRPIVSTRVSMIPEILEGCGLLVEPGDVAGLAAAITRLLDRPEEARALGGEARRRAVGRYSSEPPRAALFPGGGRVRARRSRPGRRTLA